jgi:AraC-like DNA-binding protein
MYKTAFLPYSELFYEYLESDQVHNMHVLQYHDCYEIYLLTAGERYYFINDVCHILKSGDLFIVKPFEMHYAQSLDAPFYARHLLNFPQKMLDPLLTPTEQDLLLGKLRSCIIHLDEEQFQEAEFYFRGISSANGFLAEKIQQTHLLQLLVFLSKCIEASDSLLDTAQLPGAKPEILQAIQYINRNYADNLTLDFISEKVHLSKYYFCRQFSKTVGATFLEYLNNVRLAKAHQLLLNTKLPITKIAALTGFSSGVQLSRTFQSVYKESPAAFRRKSAGESLLKQPK